MYVCVCAYMPACVCVCVCVHVRVCVCVCVWFQSIKMTVTVLQINRRSHLHSLDPWSGASKLCNLVSAHQDLCALHVIHVSFEQLKQRPPEQLLGTWE